MISQCDSYSDHHRGGIDFRDDSTIKGEKMTATIDEHIRICKTAYNELLGRQGANLSEIAADTGLGIADLLSFSEDTSLRSEHCKGYMVAYNFPFGDRVDYYPQFRGNREFWIGARDGTIAKMAENLRC